VGTFREIGHFYTDPDPWQNLSAIFDAVKADYRPAESLGYTLVQAEELPSQPIEQTPPTV
jgi:hypothetical protein